MADAVYQMDFKAGGKMGDEEIANAEEGGGSGKKKLIIILAVIIILAILVGGYLLLFSGDDKKDKKTEQDLDPTLVSSTQIDDGDFGTNPVFTDEPLEFTVNLRDRKHYLHLKIHLGMARPETKEFLLSRLPIVNDLIITTLQNKTTKDLNDPQGISHLKRSLLRKINQSVFSDEFFKEFDLDDRSPVKRILFKQFILN